MNKHVGGWLCLGLLLTADLAFANMGAGTRRVPFTDFLVELHNVTQNVYFPLICIGAVAVGACNYLWGVFRFGQAWIRIAGVVGMIGLGVVGISEALGTSTAIAVLL